MNRLSIFVAGLALTANSLSAANTIWQTLEEGDTPEQVAEKLMAMDGIRSAKAKSGKVTVRHKGEGIEIYGSHFKVVPTFEGEALSQVILGSKALCVEDARAVADDLLRALSAKYPEAMVPDDDVGRAAVLEAMRVATEAQPSEVSHIRMNDRSAVIFYQRVLHKEAPPAAYSTGQLATALSNLAWIQYDQYVRECPTHGSYRVQLVMVYSTRASLDKMRSDVEAQMNGEDKEALDRL